MSLTKNPTASTTGDSRSGLLCSYIEFYAETVHTWCVCFAKACLLRGGRCGVVIEGGALYELTRMIRELQAASERETGERESR